jgi:hypothetical protein
VSASEQATILEGPVYRNAKLGSDRYCAPLREVPVWTRKGFSEMPRPPNVHRPDFGTCSNQPLMRHTRRAGLYTSADTLVASLSRFGPAKGENIQRAATNRYASDDYTCIGPRAIPRWPPDPDEAVAIPPAVNEPSVDSYARGILRTVQASPRIVRRCQRPSPCLDA